MLCVVSQWATISVKRKPCSEASVGQATAGNTKGAKGAVTAEKRAGETNLTDISFPAELNDEAKARIGETGSEVFERSFSREEKRKLGKTCKLLLDLGRAEYLRSRGYATVRLVRYTTRSKEDILLLAK